MGAGRQRSIAFSGGLLALASLTLADAPAPAKAAPAYIFYLHGAIVENQGPQGVSDRYGRYDYSGIVAAFGKRGFNVVSEVRPRGTDVSAYADKVVGQVEELLRRGVSPSKITVVGASKGAVIASLVSTRLRNPDVRYVLLASCNDWLIRTYDPRLTGGVLSIYEESDELAQSCEGVKERSTDIAQFKELRLNTGLGHGIVYRPLKQWVGPAVAWAER